MPSILTRSRARLQALQQRITPNLGIETSGHSAIEHVEERTLISVDAYEADIDGEINEFPLEQSEGPLNNVSSFLDDCHGAVEQSRRCRRTTSPSVSSATEVLALHSSSITAFLSSSVISSSSSSCSDPSTSLKSLASSYLSISSSSSIFSGSSISDSSVLSNITSSLRQSSNTPHNIQHVVKQRCRKTALDTAHQIYAPSAVKNSIQDYVFWVDGSAYNGCGAAGVAWRLPPNYEEWNVRASCLPGETRHAERSELFAIEMALAIATHQLQDTTKTLHGDGRGRRILIFSDCSSALQRIATESREVHNDLFWDLVESISKRSSELKSLGAYMELHWVPGHSGVQGNELAHRVAYASSHGGVGCIIKVTVPSEIGLFSESESEGSDEDEDFDEDRDED